MIPIILPNVAPMAIDGTKMPAGTLHPYETTTKHVRMTVAKNNEFTMGHCTEVLTGGVTVQLRSTLREGQGQGSLAEIVVVASTITFSEQYRHAFCHVYSQEAI